jgi:hypothetical protein
MVGGLSGLNIAAGVAGLGALAAGILGDYLPRREARLKRLKLSSSSGEIGAIGSSEVIESHYEFDGHSLTVRGPVGGEELADLIQRFHSVRVIRGTQQEKTSPKNSRKKFPRSVPPQGVLVADKV